MSDLSGVKFAHLELTEKHLEVEAQVLYPAIDNGDGSTIAGVLRAPPMTGDTDYVTGVAQGGVGDFVTPEKGGNGLVVIEWE